MTQSLSDLVAHHVVAAYALVFLVSFGEALFIVGIFVPSTVVLLAAGALVGAGKLPFMPVLVLASAGAAAGDAVSFWIGHRYRDGIRLLWPFRRYLPLLDRGEVFFARHGGKSILLGRFVPGIKTVVPGIAGMTGMNVAWFTFVNVSSALVWALAHILPGAGIGRGLVAHGGFDTRWVVACGVFLLTFAVVTYVASRLYRTGTSRFGRWRRRYLERANERPVGSPDFLLRVLSNDGNIVGRSLVLLVGTLAAGVFATLVADLLFDPELRAADQAVFNYLQSIRTEANTRIVTAVTMAADGFVLTGLTLAIVAWLVYRRRFGLAFVMASAMAATSLFVPAIKSIIQRPRPTALYSGAESFSFPSGHATQSSVMLGMLAVVFASNMAPRYRPVIFSLSAAGALAVGFSRLFLGAHWLSDVCAGLAFGTLITAVFAASTWKIDRSVRPGALAVLLVTSFLPIYGYHMARSYESWLEAYAPSSLETSLSQAEWLEGGWRSVDRHRLTLGGDEAGQFVVQTDLPPGSLAGRVASLGWSPVRVGGILDAILPSATPLGDRPASPLLHDGRHARLVFVRYGRGQRERDVLAFWPAFRKVSSLDGEILVGGLSRETLDPILGGYATIRVDEARTSGSNLDVAILSSGRATAMETTGAIALWPADGPSIVVDAAR